MNCGQALNQYFYLRSFGTSFDKGYMDELSARYYEIDLPNTLVKLPKPFSDHYMESNQYHDWYIDTIKISGDFRHMTLQLIDRLRQGQSECCQVKIEFNGVYPLHVQCDENENLFVTGKDNEKQIFGMMLELSQKQKKHFYCHLLTISGNSIAWGFSKLDFHMELLPAEKKKTAKSPNR